MSQARAWGVRAEVGARTEIRAGLMALLPWLVLAAITLGALALRLWAIGQRLPYTVNVDEPVVVDQASGILLRGDLNPHRFVYPSLQIYLQAGISWLHLQWGMANGLYGGLSDIPAGSHVITSAPGFYIWGRAGTAVLGALTVLFTGLAGRGLAGWGAGLIAALLLAVSPLHTGHSRFVTPDVPASCFTALALLGAVAVWRQPPALGSGRRLLLYGLAGAAFGLATATKYNAVVIGVCLLLAHLLARPPRAWLAAPDLWLAGAAALGAFFLVTPFALIDRATFLEDVGSIIHHYKYLGHTGFESDQNWRWYLSWLLRNEPWLILPALAGAVWAALRHRGRDLLLLIFPLASYAGLASYKVHFERNLLPLFPFLALLAAGLIVDLGAGLVARWPRARGPLLPATALLALLLAARPGLATTEIAAHLARPDSRPAAVAWLRANVPPTMLVVADLEPQLWEGASSIHAAQFVSPPHEKPPEWFSARGYRYIVVRESRYGRYQGDRARYPREAAAYDRLFAEMEEVARFDDEGGYAGPEIRVLRLEARADSLTMGNPLGVRLGPVELLGATIVPVSRMEDIALTGTGRSRFVRQGGIVGLTLFWRPAASLETDYVVFVHVVDDQGKTVAQRDTQPQNGGNPTSGWRAGEVVVDPANVPLPPAVAPGRYRVVVGLYRPGDGARLPAQPGTPERPDSVEVGTVEVRRP